MDTYRSCPTCGFSHYVDSICMSTNKDGSSKTCSKDCQHNGYPLNRAACKPATRSPPTQCPRWAPTNLLLWWKPFALARSTSVGTQYDTGCQLSLISKSVLQVLPVDMYSIGKPARVRILAYAGEEETILTTEVQLKQRSCSLQLYVFEDALTTLHHCQS